MHPEKVREALYLLRKTDSFLGENWFSQENVLTKHKEFIRDVLRSRPKDIALGLYVNNIEILDCLIITNGGIFSIYKTNGRYIPFESIKGTSTPLWGDQEIDVELEDNQFETISVLGETDTSPDIFVFDTFLKQLVNKANTEVFDDLNSVETAYDLVCVMTKHFGMRSGIETRTRLENFEKEFSEHNIDPDIKQAKGFWRLIGLWRIDDALLNQKPEET
jgi:hypothetical protein